MWKIQADLKIIDKINLIFNFSFTNLEQCTKIGPETKAEFRKKAGIEEPAAKCPRLTDTLTSLYQTRLDSRAFGFVQN
jgi:hypothetical protein